jgi:hypothetical protein
MTPENGKSANGDVPKVERDANLASAGEILEAVVAQSDEEVGSSVGADEAAEYGYDYAVADARAVNALRRVVTKEGFEFDEDFAPRLPSR